MISGNVTRVILCSNCHWKKSLWRQLKNHHESFHQENPPLTDCLYRVSCWSLVLFYQHGSRSQSNGGPNPQYWDYSLRVEEGEKPLLRKSLIIVRIDVWQKFIGPGRPWAWHIKKIFSFFEWLTVPLESATSVLAKRIFRRLWQNFPQWRSWWVIGGDGSVFLPKMVTLFLKNVANIAFCVYLFQGCPKKNQHTAEGLLNSGGQGCNPNVTLVPIHFLRLMHLFMKSVSYQLFNVDSRQLRQPANQNKRGKNNHTYREVGKFSKLPLSFAVR